MWIRWGFGFGLFLSLVADINLGSDLWISFMPDFKLFGFDLDWLEMRLIWVLYWEEKIKGRYLVKEKRFLDWDLVLLRICFLILWCVFLIIRIKSSLFVVGDLWKVVFVVEVSSQRDMVSLCSTIFEEQVLEISITFIEWKSSFLEIWEDTVLMKNQLDWFSDWFFELYKTRGVVCQSYKHLFLCLLALRSWAFSLFRLSLSWEFIHGFWVFKMSQSGLVGKNMGEKKAAGLVPKRRIKIPHFDNSALIAGYSKTLFGRCMNPRKQEMKTLLFMLPRVWQIEGKVVGADLGLGRFQFDFESEDDIEAVLKMEPLHFDHWMVSLVRWSPSVVPNYPSAITFWIRVLGVPIELWADPTFRFIGEDLGVVKEVDIHGGRVQVTVDGFKPLCFETEVEFGNSAETTMFLQYERLYGFCKRCHSLCHEEALCGFSAVPCFVYVNQTEEVDEGRHLQSYKGAAAQGTRQDSRNDGKLSGGYKGKNGADGHKDD